MQTFTGTLVCDEALYSFAREILTELRIKFLPCECGFDIEAINAAQYQEALERLSELAGPMGHHWSFRLD